MFRIALNDMGFASETSLDVVSTKKIQAGAYGSCFY